MLTSKQKRCIELMAAGDRTQRQIAEILHVSEATICNWKKNENFKAEYTLTLKENMKDVAAKAFNTMMGLLRAKSEMVRFLAAKDILDRAGFKADDNINISLEPVTITDDLKE